MVFYQVFEYHSNQYGVLKNFWEQVKKCTLVTWSFRKLKMKRSRVEDILIIRKDVDVVKALKRWSTSKSNLFSILVKPGSIA